MRSTTARFTALASGPLRADFENGDSERFVVQAVDLTGDTIRAVVRLADTPSAQFRLVGTMGEDRLELQHAETVDFDDPNAVFRSSGFETVGTVVGVSRADADT
ncbi:hypothetical protein [Salinirubrum litoreum]|uniref:Uncharacterized protein n=1 Tax=Salinirubrum litoreum TaxID=1126234 RepID=A0ABD5R8I2_9EURY|nr:hypothetical protein [Salinirubrum litoreum]